MEWDRIERNWSHFKGNARRHWTRLSEAQLEHIEDTGEVNWLVADALRMEVPVPVIAQSVMQLFGSRDRAKDWARAIVAMRHEFGGHPYGKDEEIAKERRESRVGEIFRPDKPQ